MIVIANRVSTGHTVWSSSCEMYLDKGLFVPFVSFCHCVVDTVQAVKEFQRKDGKKLQWFLKFR